MTAPSSLGELKTVIQAAWAERDGINTATKGQVRDAVNETLSLLDAGKLRVAERGADGAWTVNQWAKEAILLSFRLNASQVMEPGPYWDKVPLKFEGWGAAQFEAAGFRAVPGCVVRRSAFV